jgi:hypothetical protein
MTDQPATVGSAGTGGQRDLALLAGLLALLVLPLAVGLAVLRRPTWQPVLDLAMTELRLRDVGTAHTPLIGLPGRIGTLAEQGSHPGPLSFYGLAPTYKLLGSTAWAMQVGAVVLNALALGLALWIADRRGGRPLLLAAASLLALLVAGYGVSPLTEPWNPYLPMLWWVVVLLGAWSVLVDDLPILLVVVAAASFAGQTHLPYTGLAGGMTGFVLAVLVVRAIRDPEARRRILRWVVAGLALGAVLWLPPVVEQLDPPAGTDGNLRLIADSMLTPEDDPVGMGEAVSVALRHLDVTAFVVPGDGGTDGGDGALLESSFDADGSVVVGVVVLAAWLAAAGWSVAHRRRAGDLVALHAVVAVGLGLGLLSISRIYGKVWYYLTLWAWGTALVLVLATGWTLVEALRPGWDAHRRSVLTRVGAVTAGAVLVLSTVVFVIDAADAPTPDDNLSETLGALLPPTMSAIEAGEGPATGTDGRYRVTWNDAFYFGSQGFGLVSELERRGLDAVADHTWRVPVTRHRALDDAPPEGQATATVALATGIYVDQWRSVPGAVEVAFVEPRDDEELAEYERLREDVLAGLAEAGLDDLVEQVDSNLFGASIDERLPDDVEEAMARMLLLGQESAIFLAPPGAHL